MGTYCPTMVFPDDVTVVIVAHNARDHLDKTMGSLAAAGCPVNRITVVDVASTDGCPEWVQARWPGVAVYCLDENKGPNPARNVGLKEAQTPYVLVMDSDVSVEPDTIPHLRAAMNPGDDVAITSPIVLYADKPDTIQYGGTKIHYLCEAVNPWQGRTIDERGTEQQEIGCASGNALMISRHIAIKLGLFDERFFMGKEDGEFTHRVRIAGYKIIEEPKARVLHECGQRGTDLFYYQLKNRWHFILKNYQIRTLVLLTPIMVLHEILQLAVLTLKGHGKTYFKAVKTFTEKLPAILRDRTMVSKVRTRRDWEVLSADSMLIREDMLCNGLLRRGKAVYDAILRSYWSFLKKILKYM